MKKLTIEQIKEATKVLHKLADISRQREKAFDEARAANIRWNEARTQYAELHAEFVKKYGEEYAPTWINELYGKRS